MADETGVVLVVDDDPLNRMVLTRALEKQGHEVRTASTGEQALESLRAQRADVVLLDVVMPGMSGLDVLQEMKRDGRLREIPVVMVSALDDYDHVVRSIEAGAEDYLPKPFDPVLLRARIRAGLARARLHTLEQERVRGVFTRFLPEEVVDELLEHSDGDLPLGGVRVTGTALISDLRGFTAYAEATPPEIVVHVLNQYFEQMSQAVLSHGGTLLSYLGDGLLAVFGAPIPSEDHADRAVRAAREMAGPRLDTFNDWLTSERLGQGFAMGIGVASGPFMSGNVGSEQRLEYTAIGDPINLASRLQALTKEHPHRVLISDATASLLASGESLLRVGESAIRGRTQRTLLWSLR